MKKIISILLMSLLTIVAIGQKTQTYDLIIQKAVPVLSLKGSGAFINYNNGDVTETLTSNLITFAGGNVTAPNFIQGYTTTATATSTTTLTSSSTHLQFFTGTAIQTVLLPVTSTLALGWQYYIINNSTLSVTVQSSGANTICVLAGGTRCRLTCILTSGTNAASWSFYYQGVGMASGVKLNFTGTT